jgi:hypothetical protein
MNKILDQGKELIELLKEKNNPFESLLILHGTMRLLVHDLNYCSAEEIGNPTKKQLEILEIIKKNTLNSVDEICKNHKSMGRKGT